MLIVNCGCGNKYSNKMTNLDFISNNPDIISCNILKGLPFEKNSVDWIYNSHFLEHLTPDEAEGFLGECYSRLKVGGGIRIALPDLEEACRNYLSMLEKVREDNSYSSRYEYSVIELIDQFTRDKTGGYMAEYWLRDNKDMEYLEERLGTEIHNILKNYEPVQRESLARRFFKLFKAKPFGAIKFAFSFVMKKVNRVLWGRTDFYKTYQLGKFCLSGERHKWMYDTYSLRLLLEKVGFKNIQIRKHSESDMPEFKEMGLEVNADGTEYKPNSIYVEAYK